jgi:purine nucleoside permease
MAGVTFNRVAAASSPPLTLDIPSRMRLASALLLLSVATSAACQTAAASKPIEIKVVVLSMFEAGADTGDVPGEYQYWVERQHLDTVLPFPQGFHDLRLNPKSGVLGVLTGVGTARAASTVMALGLDPRFDLTHAYFLVAGIGGMDPNAGSLASAVWSDWIVDGDLAYEIDAREIPHDTPEQRALWTTGYVPLRKSVPYEQPADPAELLVYRLNAGLVDWAYQLTRNVALPIRRSFRSSGSTSTVRPLTDLPSCSKALTSPPAPSGMAG